MVYGWYRQFDSTIAKILTRKRFIMRTHKLNRINSKFIMYVLAIGNILEVF